MIVELQIKLKAYGVIGNIEPSWKFITFKIECIYLHFCTKVIILQIDQNCFNMAMRTILFLLSKLSYSISLW